MKIVALLPMKANSERVKGKNFRNFCGKPLFRWILDALESVEEIDEVVFEKVDLIDIQESAIGFCQQAGLKGLFALGQGALQVQGTDHAILRRAQGQVYDGN